MDAHDLMTQAVTTVPPSLPVAQAHAMMLELEARHLPVVSADRQLIGILSDRDVLLCASRGKDSFVYPKLTVGEVMTAAPITAGPHTPVRELASLMLEHKIDAVPIVTPSGELAGLITSSDLLRVVSAK